MSDQYRFGLRAHVIVRRYRIESTHIMPVSIYFPSRFWVHSTSRWKRDKHVPAKQKNVHHSHDEQFLRPVSKIFHFIPFALNVVIICWKPHHLQSLDKHLSGRVLIMSPFRHSDPDWKSGYWLHHTERQWESQLRILMELNRNITMKWNWTWTTRNDQKKAMKGTKLKMILTTHISKGSGRSSKWAS